MANPFKGMTALHIIGGIIGGILFMFVILYLAYYFHGEAGNSYVPFYVAGLIIVVFVPLSWFRFKVKGKKDQRLMVGYVFLIAGMIAVMGYLTWNW